MQMNTCILMEDIAKKILKVVVLQLYSKLCSHSVFLLSVLSTFLLSTSNISVLDFGLLVVEHDT